MSGGEVIVLSYERGCGQRQTLVLWVRLPEFDLGVFFGNPNLYPARVQQGTEADTYV